MVDLDRLQAVARAAVLAGGEELRGRYRTEDVDGAYGPYDVTTAADAAAEARMLPVVRSAFPHHAVFAEESGEFAGTEPYRWIIDPLDGTNNFAVGLATFGTSIAVLREGEPVLAVVHRPATAETYVARRGGGVRYEGDPATVDDGPDHDLSAATVATIVGRNVPRDRELDRRARHVREALDATVKRVISSWAPTVHSTSFARGRLRGIVQFHPDEEERAVTELFAAEAGASTRRDGPLYVAATDEETLASLWDAVDGAS